MRFAPSAPQSVPVTHALIIQSERSAPTVPRHTHTWLHKHCHIWRKLYHYTVFRCCLSPGALCWPVGSTIRSRGWWRWTQTANLESGHGLEVLVSCFLFYFVGCHLLLSSAYLCLLSNPFSVSFLLLFFLHSSLVRLIPSGVLVPVLWSSRGLSAPTLIRDFWFVFRFVILFRFFFCSLDFSAFCYLHLGFWIGVSSLLELAFISFPSGGERLQRRGNRRTQSAALINTT